MRISDWSSDVCSSDLQTIFFVDDDAPLREANLQTLDLAGLAVEAFAGAGSVLPRIDRDFAGIVVTDIRMPGMDGLELRAAIHAIDPEIPVILITGHADVRSEEHTSELQSLMRISYAVFCLKKKKTITSK